jgi:very-short-patch-repair endonuclease
VCDTPRLLWEKGLGEEVLSQAVKELTAMKTTSGVVRLQKITDDKLNFAKALRRNMTYSENLLWQKLRKGQLGVKFRRQQIIEGFVADFYCETAKLVIEVDGPIHDTEEQKADDEHRRNVFQNRGLREIRFSNNQVDNDIVEVIGIISKYLL